MLTHAEMTNGYEREHGEKVSGGLIGAPTGNELQLYALIRDIRNSVDRIVSASSQCTPGSTPPPLLKSDIDNASRHAQSVARNLRELKKLLFPAKEKTETNGTAAQLEQ